MIHHKPERHSLYYIYHLILNQRKLIYTTCDALKYVLRCLICRKSKSLRNLKGGKRDFELDKGIQMLNRDLDIVHFLEMNKDYHLIKQVLFNHDDRLLIKMQYRDLICTSSSDGESSSKASIRSRKFSHDLKDKASH